MINEPWSNDIQQYVESWALAVRSDWMVFLERVLNNRTEINGDKDNLTGFTMGEILAEKFLVKCLCIVYTDDKFRLQKFYF